MLVGDGKMRIEIGLESVSNLGVRNIGRLVGWGGEHQGVVVAV